MSAERRFACTQCGACCNRAPEVELGEAAGLADVFEWHLLFRLYSLPRSLADYRASGVERRDAADEFYQTRRLLGHFSAYSYQGKALVDGRKQERTFYLTLSALAQDAGSGACPALAERTCAIYPRRPLTCRSVPLHYSQADAALPRALDAFLAMPGHACASGRDAPQIITDGRIVAPAYDAARSQAARQADLDRSWKVAIVKAMKTGSRALPSLRQIEQNASAGALSVPMTAAWQIAHEAGLLAAAELESILAQQSALSPAQPRV